MIATQEEHLLHKKHDARFPGGAFKILLEQRGIGHANVDDVMSCDKPLLKIGYLLDICLTNVPRGGRSFMTVMAVQLQAKMYLKITHKKGLGALIVLSKGLAVTPFSYTRF